MCDVTRCPNQVSLDDLSYKGKPAGTNTCLSNNCAKVCYYDKDCNGDEMCRPFRDTPKFKDESMGAGKFINNVYLYSEYKKKPKYSLCVPKNYTKYKLACSNNSVPTGFTSKPGIRTMSDCVDWSRAQKPMNKDNAYNFFIYKKSTDNDLNVHSIKGNLICKDSGKEDNKYPISHILSDACIKNIENKSDNNNTNINCLLNSKLSLDESINKYIGHHGDCSKFAVELTDYTCENNKYSTNNSKGKTVDLQNNILSDTINIGCAKPDNSICSVGYINNSDLSDSSKYSKSCTTDNQGKKYPLYLLPRTDGMSKDDYIQDLKKINEEVAEELNEKIIIKKKVLKNLITERNALTGNRDYLEQEELQKNEIKLLIRLFNERNKLQNNARSAYNNAASRANINSNAELKYNKMKINKLDKNIVTISRKILANNRRNKKDNLMGMILAVILFIVVVIASIMFIFYGVRSAKRMNSASVKTS